MRALLLTSLMTIGSIYHLDILELDTKFENCRIVFELNEVEYYKTIKCKELEEKRIEILKWIREIKNNKEFKSLI